MRREFTPDNPLIVNMNDAEVFIMLDNIRKNDIIKCIKKEVKKSNKNKLAELWVLYQAKGGK